MKLLSFFRKLFGSKDGLREETKCLTMGGEVVKFDSVESNYHVSRYLKVLMDSGQMKKYANAVKFVEKFDPTGFVTDQDFDTSRVTVNEHIIALAKTAKKLGYKCDDKEFIEWLKSLA